MAGEFSNVGSDIALDAVTGRATQTARTTYLMLLTAAPSDTSTLATVAEVTTAGYARQAVTWRAPFDSGGLRRTDNNGVITFGPFTADPPNATHCCVGSASSGTVGDFLMWWALDVAKDAAINESIQFADAALFMTNE